MNILFKEWVQCDLPVHQFKHVQKHDTAVLLSSCLKNLEKLR
jgi:hypothetical protein